MSFLPSKDRCYLDERGVSYQEVEDVAQKGVILSEFALPAGKYQVAQADILILLPPAYPDAAPDMFYVVPSLAFAGTQSEPRATQARLNFKGQRWQRWSRHNKQWRPGVDHLPTMIKRVEEALEVAA